VAVPVLQLLPAGTHCSGGLLLAGQDPRLLKAPALRPDCGGEAVE